MNNLPAMHFPLGARGNNFAKSRLFTHGAKGFHLPQVDLSVRVDNIKLL